jgi:hypothetical protein
MIESIRAFAGSPSSARDSSAIASSSAPVSICALTSWTSAWGSDGASSACSWNASRAAGQSPAAAAAAPMRRASVARLRA